MFTFQGKVYIHFFQQQQHNSAMALKNTLYVLSGKASRTCLKR